MHNKKITKRSQWVLMVAIATTGSLAGLTSVGAYEIPVHAEITTQAFERSALAGAEIGFHLGLENRDLASSKFKYPSGSAKFPPFALLAFGAEDEDKDRRPLNHFYDPANDRPLGLLGGKKSIDWALADEGEISGQEMGYGELKKNLYDALLGPQSEYDEALGRYLWGLGHVVHHIQDMAQPQHSRVDAHCGTTFCKILGLGMEPIYDPSDYEHHTWNWLYTPIMVYGDYPNSSFASPEEYWHSDNHAGLADFSNRNFVTKDTNFTGTLDAPRTDPEFSLPSASFFTVEAAPASTLEGFAADDTGVMEFVRIPVNDANTGAPPDDSHRTTTFSVFSSDLEKKGEEPFFSLNKYNYASAAAMLVPRAVGYSAGFLDYALRGRMQVDLPEDGVFSIVDQSEMTDAAKGFSKLKARVSNITPDIVRADGTTIPQGMGGGTLVAVARFRQNDCYEPDLSGELNPDFDIPAECTLGEWLSSEQTSVVSQEINLPGGIPVQGVELELDFSAEPIPINARDLLIQVVYKGQLGEEENAVAISAFDISEPTFVSFLNMSNLVWIDDKYYTMEEIESDSAVKKRLDEDEDGDPYNDRDILPEDFKSLVMDFGGAPLVLGDSLPAGRFFRLAILGKPAEAFYARLYYAHVDDNIVRSQPVLVQGWQVNTHRLPLSYYAITETLGTYHANIRIYHKTVGDTQPTHIDIWDLDSSYDLANKDPVPVTVEF